MATNTREDLSFLRHGRGLSFESELDLARRVFSIKGAFKELYGSEAEVYVRSPGRAEILGNHTDYNGGYALSCAISRSLLAAMRKRTDGVVRLHSTDYPGVECIFDIHNISKDSKVLWGNYARAVVRELMLGGKRIGGADVLLDSTVPSSGGVSSSAALELGLAYGFAALYDLTFEPLEMAVLCRRAENGPLVGAPCGLLDQATVALGQKAKLVLLDFLPADGRPLTAKLIPADLGAKGFDFVITVDPQVKRNLGDSGYPQRRKVCQASLSVLSQLLSKTVTSLREVSIPEYESCKNALAQQGGDVMRKRVEHIVYENQRVLDGAQALEWGQVERFGELLTAAGHSALELYGLDERTPELTLLVESGRTVPGVMGTRNMGGGFSAITLSLLKREAVPDFESKMAEIYRSHFKRPLQFIEFEATQGVEVL